MYVEMVCMYVYVCVCMCVCGLYLLIIQLFLLRPLTHDHLLTGSATKWLGNDSVARPRNHSNGTVASSQVLTQVRPLDKLASCGVSDTHQPRPVFHEHDIQHCVSFLAACQGVICSSRRGVCFGIVFSAVFAFGFIAFFTVALTGVGWVLLHGGIAFLRISVPTAS